MPVVQNAQDILLQGQLQQALGQLHPEQFQVKLGRPLFAGAKVIATPALSVVDVTCTQPMVRWVIDRIEGGSACLTVARSLSQRYARLGIAECWILGLPQVELRAYRSLEQTSSKDRLYQDVRLYMAGSQIIPRAIPEIVMRVQEPLPLFFLTRTARDQKTYPTRALPLQVCSPTTYPHGA